jgi:3-hydroxy-9,10-secoandrosta-1,3,5(10)-triene-9,17-dione monooxygenase reductase component
VIAMQTAPAIQPAPPALDEPSVRAAFGRFATGVAFVTTERDGTPLGLVVSSFAAVSLDPPMISFCPSRNSMTWRRMRLAHRFAVNVLGAHHAEFAGRAAAPGADRFSDADTERGASGMPVLRDALAVLECEIATEHVAGDHWIVLGHVRRLRVSDARDPLVHFGGSFGTVRPG